MSQDRPVLEGSAPDGLAGVGIFGADGIRRISVASFLGRDAKLSAAAAALQRAGYFRVGDLLDLTKSDIARLTKESGRRVDAIVAKLAANGCEIRDPN